MLSLLFGLILFIFGILFVNFIIPDVTTFRTELSCSSPTSISDGTKLTCLLGDGVVPYFIVLLISTAGGIMLSRLAI